MEKLLLPLMAILAVSCGPKSQSVEDKPGVYINNLNRTPIKLIKEYPVCEGREAETDSSFFSLDQFLMGTSYDRFVDMTPSLRGGELKGRQIRQTLYDANMRLERRFQNGREAGAEFLITNSPKQVNICPGVKDYERYSYENAGMSGTYAIGKTAEKLREIGYEASSGVDVFISPDATERFVFETDEEIITQDYKITDNAFYFPHIQAVVFLPQSEESRDGNGFGNVPLWEVPMVGSHEYAHHVFHSIMNNAANELSVYSHSCFSSVAKPAGLEANGMRTVEVADVLNSLNEGFADLIAYYTLDNEERGLDGVVCMETSREVGSRTFANGERKAFDRKFMRIFLANERVETVGCYSPDYQAIHIVGAVFASVANRLMNSLGLDKKEKLATTISWLQEMNKRFQTYSQLGPEKFLLKSYTLLAAAAMDRSAMFNYRKCAYAREFMPYSDYQEEELKSLGCE